MTPDKNITPLMRQYFDIKNRYPDTLLLFQVGDFYELFFEDAQKAAQCLGIALTKRGTHKGEPIPLCGVPLHAADRYIGKLIQAEFKVALCDQLEIAKPGKVVDRGVTQVLTPGTLTDSKLLDEKSASYLCICFPTAGATTLMFAELLTGQLFATTIAKSYEDTSFQAMIDAELNRFMPAEIVLPQNKIASTFLSQFQQKGYSVSIEHTLSVELRASASSWFERQFPSQRELLQRSKNYTDATDNSASRILAALQHSQNDNEIDQNGKSYGPNRSQSYQVGSDSFIFALALLYSYLQRNNEEGLNQLKQFHYYKPEDYLLLDSSTQRNLELVKNAQDGSSAYTLFSVLDTAQTSMGSRMLKKWLLRPMIKKESIIERLDAVEKLITDHELRSLLRKHYQSVGDIERIVGRIALKRAQLHDYSALCTALASIPLIKNLIDKSMSVDVSNNRVNDVGLLRVLSNKIEDLSSLEQLLVSSLNDDTSNEWLIKTGYDVELDRLRSIASKGAQAMFALEQKEQQATGINSLKIRYNQVQGYGIEITNPNLKLVPTHYVRTQTLANRERFTTQELKDLERDIERSKHEVTAIERALFEKIKSEVETFLPALKKAAFSIAYLDALTALAQTAYMNHFVRPTFNDEQRIAIIEGRHPVVETRLKSRFIPNDFEMSDQNSLWIITGPNMGGKSTFLRQVALISILAQMGSFVSAGSANLTILDRIFTRIGAADNVAEGKSTFLVEMEETALICNQATKQSLVILDEVGRGTSTFDGLAIAQAVIEHIYHQIQARCLFATHYHELTALCDTFEGIHAYHAACVKTEEGIVLLHKINPGIADGSFGLEVAALAQLPSQLIARAREIVEQLAGGSLTIKEHAYNVDKQSVISNKQNGISLNPGTKSDNKGQSIVEKAKITADREYVCKNCAHKNDNPDAIKAAQLIKSEVEHINESERTVLNELAQLNCEQLTAKQALDLVWHLKEKLG